MATYPPSPLFVVLLPLVSSAATPMRELPELTPHKHKVPAPVRCRSECRASSIRCASVHFVPYELIYQPRPTVLCVPPAPSPLPQPCQHHCTPPSSCACPPCPTHAAEASRMSAP
ncbi:hypothetical protein BJV78DRAFT_1262579 [Lactifluus subvellereus]|nr:hypothetical protein BJV78DRAFT_1262579 [Lactifluus subvellereus]